MNKKELLKKTEEIVKNKIETSASEIDKCGSELSAVIFNKGIHYILLSIIFMLLSLILFDKANKLSFIDLDFYIVFLSIFLGISFISSLVFFTLYIYNKKNNNIFTLKVVKRTHQYHQVFDLIGFVCSIVTVMLWLVMFVATPIEVTGDSMENNYHEKDKILVWHLFYDVEYFDVVIVDVVDKYDFNEGTEFVIKRVVAVGGDKITYDPITQVVCRNGKQIAKNVRVDDFKNMLTIDSLDEEYYSGYEGIVPEGYCILLGDNRAVSKDSRSVGLIKKEDILGKCFFRIYPFNAIGLVD